MQIELDYALPFATLDDWIFFKSGSFVTGPFSEEFVVISLHSEPFSPQWLAAADQASKVRNLLPGVQLTFQEQPSPGFVWLVEKGWELHDAVMATRKLEGLIREIQRISGGHSR